MKKNKKGIYQDCPKSENNVQVVRSTS